MAETKKVTVAELLAAMSIQNQRIEALQQMLETQSKGTAAKPLSAKQILDQMVEATEEPPQGKPRLLTEAECQALGVKPGTVAILVERFAAPVKRYTSKHKAFADYGSVEISKRSAEAFGLDLRDLSWLGVVSFRLTK